MDKNIFKYIAQDNNCFQQNFKIYPIDLTNLKEKDLDPLFLQYIFAFIHKGLTDQTRSIHSEKEIRDNIKTIEYQNINKLQTVSLINQSSSINQQPSYESIMPPLISHPPYQLTDQQMRELSAVLQARGENMRKYIQSIGHYLKDTGNKEMIGRLIQLMDKNDYLEASKHISSFVYGISPVHLQNELLALLPTSYIQLRPNASPIQSQLRADTPAFYPQIKPNTLLIQSQQMPNTPPIQPQSRPNTPPIQLQSRPNTPLIQLQSRTNTPPIYHIESQETINNTYYIFCRFIYYIQYYVFNASTSFEPDKIKKIIWEPEKRFSNNNNFETPKYENAEIINEIRYKKQLNSNRIKTLEQTITELQKSLDICKTLSQS